MAFSRLPQTTRAGRYRNAVELASIRTLMGRLFDRGAGWFFRRTVGRSLAGARDQDSLGASSNTLFRSHPESCVLDKIFSVQEVDGKGLNVTPVAHRRWSSMASFRAKATVAFFFPTLATSC